jgi:hypothetical protein
VFASEPEIGNVSQLTNLARGSGGIYRPGFGRPNFTCSSFDQAITGYSAGNVPVLNTSCFASALGGFGNLGRNTFRGPSQKRFDLSISKQTKISDRMSFDIGFDLFNVFNTTNFANPNSDLQDSVDFGVITNTVGGPRVGQFRAKFRF